MKLIQNRTFMTGLSAAVPGSTFARQRGREPALETTASAWAVVKRLLRASSTSPEASAHDVSPSSNMCDTPHRQFRGLRRPRFGRERPDAIGSIDAACRSKLIGAFRLLRVDRQRQRPGIRDLRGKPGGRVSGVASYIPAALMANCRA